MKQVFNYSGSIIVEEIDIPILDDNSILVQNHFSAISIGTEKTTISKKQDSTLLKRLLKKENLKRGFDLIKEKGLVKTLQIVKKSGEKLLLPLGYSSAGRVIAVGKNISNFAVGDLVACAGGGYACHAEIIKVPKNLAVKIPRNVSMKDASFTTLGAIALQGVRRSNVTLGEVVLVYGVGIIGQITCQLLSAAGINVIALDLKDDRLEIAKNNGVKFIINPNKADTEKEIFNFTQGLGVDAVIICASNARNEIIDQSMQFCRKKGRIVIVGDVGLDLKRDLMYSKELDILISTSYGPGRYDKKYEQDGQDYPISYVRWTENRNMKAFLNLLKDKKLNFSNIINHEFTIEKAIEAYDVVRAEAPLGVVLKYPDDKISLDRLTRKTILKKETKEGKLKVAVIGAGSFAKNYHLPNLLKINECSIEVIVSQNPINARNTANKYRANITSSDYKEILDEDIDLAVITTQHDTHAQIAIDFAKKKINVLVEKPLALTIEDCERISKAAKSNKVEVAIGFNRRFALFSQKAKKCLQNRKTPLVLSYRINSSNMARDHWINDPIKGGGAILGEAVHFFDYCNWIIDSEIISYEAEMISSNNEGIIDANNIICTLKYRDGSIASVIYTTIGNQNFDKERIEFFFDNKVILIEDFKKIEFHGIKEKNEFLKAADKGHFQFLDAYIRYLLGKRDSTDLPLLDDGIEATKCAINILEKAKNKQ